MLVARVGLPRAVLIVGSTIFTSQKSAENDVKFIEIAISAVNVAPSEGNHAIRSWAINVLAAKSPVAIQPEVRAELEKERVQWMNGSTWSNYPPNTPVDYDQVSHTRFKESSLPDKLGER